MMSKFEKGDIVQCLTSHYLDEQCGSPSIVGTGLFKEKEVGVVIDVGATKVKVACSGGVGWSHKSIIALT